MKKVSIFFVILLVSTAWLVSCGQPTPIPTPSPTPTSSPTVAPSPTLTPTPPAPPSVEPSKDQTETLTPSQIASPLKEGLFISKDGDFIGVADIEKIPEKEWRDSLTRNPERLIDNRFLIYKVVTGGFNPIWNKVAFEELDPVPIPEIEINWTSTELPQNGNPTAVVIDDNEGNRLYTVGLLPGQIRTLYVWQSTTGGNSWKFIGRLGDLEIGFKNEKQIYEDWVVNAKVSLFETKKDPNNEKIILRPLEYTTYWGHWVFVLSLDDGKYWLKINFPPGVNPKGNVILTDKYHFDLISSDGVLKLFFAHEKVWRGVISLPK